MKPFTKSSFPIKPQDIEAAMAKLKTKDAYKAGKYVEKQLEDYLGIPYINDEYQVNVTKVGKGLVELSIKRRDKEPIDENHWRILQEIKNLMVGDENEGAELFPAESRKFDTANQYYLFVFTDPKERFPFGYTERCVLTSEEAAKTGAKQRDY